MSERNDRDSSDEARGRRRTRGLVTTLGAWCAALVALVGGPGTAAWIAFGLAVLALVLRITVDRHARRATVHVSTLLALAVGGLTAPELPAPAPSYEALAEATAEASRRWDARVATLSRAIDDPPPAGGDFAWLDRRADELGVGAGVSVVSLADGTPLSWAGRTTPLAPDEVASLEKELRGEAVESIAVLRRGLTQRLLLARTFRDEPGLAVVAEVPLPREPAVGDLTPRVPGVEAWIRWRSSGEGLRADLATGARGDDAPFWSMHPLMSPNGKVVGRLSLGIRDADALAAERSFERQSRTATAVILALLLSAAIHRRAAVPLIVVARAIAIAVPPALPAALMPLARGWPRIVPPDAPYWLRSLLDGPAATVGTGACLLLAVALTPLPRGRWARWMVGALGAAGIAGGLVLAHALTARGGSGALELTGDPPIVARLIGLLALALPGWAGGILLCRSLPRLLRAAPLVVAAVGALAGVVHGLGIVPGAQTIVEDEVVPELAGRVELWRRAVATTLELAVPPPGSDVLAPERDAIDLWWKGPLGRLGLASGVWKYGPGSVLEDAFVTGLPPIPPAPELPYQVRGDDEVSTAELVETLVGPFPRSVRDPEAVTLESFGQVVELLVAEVGRPEGGSWVAAVLAEPGNLPSRRASDPLMLARRGERRGERPELPASPGRDAKLSWFDISGRLVTSDLVESPPPPPASLDAPRWRGMEIEGRRARSLEIPDPEGRGMLVATFYEPDTLQRVAIAVGWALVLALSTAVALGAVALGGRVARGELELTDPLRWLTHNFRAQVAVSLVVAGLLPLLGLGLAGRYVARSSADRQLAEAAAARIGDARRFLEDYVAVEVDGVSYVDDGVASWLSRTLNNDIYAWVGGELQATSRSDLVRAGLWPERLSGDAWQAVGGGRRPLFVETTRAPAFERPPDAQVAHGPFFDPRGDVGVVSLPLGLVGTRLSLELATVDRALLISAALLFALAGLVLVPTSRRFARPLLELEAATSRIAGGNFDANVPETGYEETRALARALRSMAASLSSQQAFLERRRAAMEALIDAMPLAVVATSHDGRVWAANAQAEELFDAQPGALLREGDDGPLRSALVRLMEGRGELTQTVEIAAEEGNAHFRITARDLPGARLSERTRLGVVEDLTDSLRSERLAAWAGMARRIAHEIKNPLTPISLVVDHARQLSGDGADELPDRLEPLFDTIAEQVLVLRETAREFSDYARLIEAHPEPVDVGVELERWLRGYVVAPPEGLRVSIDVHDPLPPVVVDPRLLRRAVINLVDNAMQATRAGGEVRLRVTPLDDESGIEISVEDTGPGIDPARRSELFEPGVTTRETGSGLGLAIARQAIEAHGGTLELDAAYEEGARFVARLPLAPSISDRPRT